VQKVSSNENPEILKISGFFAYLTQVATYWQSKEASHAFCHGHLHCTELRSPQCGASVTRISRIFQKKSVPIRAICGKEWDATARWQLRLFRRRARELAFRFPADEGAGRHTAVIPELSIRREQADVCMEVWAVNEKTCQI
jgi:hypothetical protein